MRTPRPDIRNRRQSKRQHMLLALLIAVALVVPFRTPFAAPATTESTIVLQTAGAPLLQTTAQVVNNELGNQTNPHVQCDLASYTFDDFQGHSTIHYQNMATGADNVIPGNEVDLLSDTSDSRVAYTEVTFSGDTVRVFDTISQTQTIVPGFGRSNPSIGGNIVAFEDRSVSANGPQMAIYNLSTRTVTQLTDGSLVNKNPNVSPDGDAIVWEQCQTNELNCAVYAAVQTALGVFTTKALTQPGGTNHSPSTNGSIAVYISDRSGENDVYYQDLASGAEVHLAIPGNQRKATISGELISFESQNQNGFDIFVYDIRSGKLFQVTNTPDDKRLSEISVCNGAGRIVYTVVGVGAFDVVAVSFAVPNVTEDQVNDLIALIRSFNLAPGTANSLITKLQDVLTAIDASDTATACSNLTAFVNAAAAQSGKKLTASQATQLIDSANSIKADLGCGPPTPVQNASLAQTASLAQSAEVTQRTQPQVKTDTRILYHGGPLVTGSPDVYLIWYGCWAENCGSAGDTATQFILTDFLSNVGGSPYFQINAMYPDTQGHTPSGALLYSGAAVDRYSYGLELTAADLQGIVSDLILAGQLPLNPSGIYLILASADVSSTATGFCQLSAQPHHGRGMVLGTDFRYGFVGNPVRCPAIAAAQFVASDGSRLPTPNGNFGADGMANTMAHLLDGIVTNPFGNGWFDKYGLENADKCAGTFGQTYTTTNGARANLRLGARDYLIQQNWVNDRKGHCAMNSSL